MSHEYSIPSVPTWRSVIFRIVKGMGFNGVEPGNVQDGTVMNAGVEQVADNTAYLYKRLPLKLFGVIVLAGDGTPTVHSTRTWSNEMPLPAASVDGITGAVSLLWDTQFVTALGGVAPVVEAQAEFGATSFGAWSNQTLVHDVTTSGFKVSVVSHRGIATLADTIYGDVDANHGYRFLGYVPSDGRVLAVRARAQTPTTDATEALTLKVYKSPADGSSATEILSTPMVLDDGNAYLTGSLESAALDVQAGEVLWYDITRTTGGGDIMADLSVQADLELKQRVQSNLNIFFSVEAKRT